MIGPLPGLGCGFSSGISFVFARLGLKDAGGPMAGVLAACIAATPAVCET